MLKDVVGGWVESPEPGFLNILGRLIGSCKFVCALMSDLGRNLLHIYDTHTGQESELYLLEIVLNVSKNPTLAEK